MPFTSIADALYLFPYPFYAVAVVRLARGVRRQRPAEDSLDAPIVTIGALALLWHFLMHSYARDNALSVVERVVTLAYPVMDIGILFVVVSSLVFAGDRCPATRLIVASMAAVMIGDLGYDLLVLHDSYQSGNAIDFGFLAS